MIWELVFLAVFVGGMWSAGRLGYRNGMEMGVMTTLRNLEVGDIIKVKNNPDGSTVSRHYQRMRCTSIPLVEHT